MKNKKALLILCGIFVACFFGVSIFFALQGFSASYKRQSYIDTYWAIAEEYIKSDSEILNKYGNDASVELDTLTIDNGDGKRSFFDIFAQVFAPRVPDTLEEFTSETEAIIFNVKINGDLYCIIFEKNGSGELVVSSLTKVKEQ